MNDSVTAPPTQRHQLVIERIASLEPVIGGWLGAIQDTRVRTLECIEGLDPRAIDRVRDDENTISSLLYHVAAIEADWLYVEVLEQPFPPEIIARFPHDVRDADGRLTHVAGVSLYEHLERLAVVHNRLLAAFELMTLEDFQRTRQLPKYDVTPAWVLHHLMQHEAEHRGQIGLLHATAERGSS